VNVVAKYYNLAGSGSAPLMFLNCNGYLKQSQNNCGTYSANGLLMQIDMISRVIASDM